jgi:hypothetical protein
MLADLKVTMGVVVWCTAAMEPQVPVDTSAAADAHPALREAMKISVVFNGNIIAGPEAFRIEQPDATAHSKPLTYVGALHTPSASPKQLDSSV